ncbi:hypothetical protein CEO41_28055, partial [Klebsiella pneumoniae]
FHRISSCSVIPKIAYSDMLHQHQVTPLLTLRYLQYLCELTHSSFFLHHLSSFISNNQYLALPKHAIF